MKKIKLIIFSLLFVLGACQKNEVNPGADFISPESSQKNKKAKLHLDIQGLEALGSAAKYEGWLIVAGNPVSTGRFVVNANGGLAPSHFNVKVEDLEAASMFVVTIEPNPDRDPRPSDTHILAGAFSGNSAVLSVGHPAALGDDYSSAYGKYLLATPTTSSMMDEDAGVWFIDNSSGSGMAGLSLRTLPAGWKYEGWAVINGSPLSTGTFLSVNQADDAAPFSGPMAGPPFPGEDFVSNAPTGFTFPAHLSGSTVVVSIEPYPDNSPAPFLLKPIVGQVPQGAMVHTTYSLTNNAGSFPIGSARR